MYTIIRQTGDLLKCNGRVIDEKLVHTSDINDTSNHLAINL